MNEMINATPRRKWCLGAVALVGMVLVARALAQPSARDWIPGTIVRIDLEAGRVTLKHIGIAHLYLPPGETTFRYTEQKYVNGRNPGDQVLFKADRIELELRMTALIYLSRAS